jgi:hypothetical protein
MMGAVAVSWGCVLYVLGFGLGFGFGFGRWFFNFFI